MNYNSYIEDAPRVSEIGLGAWQLGENSGWKSMSEKAAIHMVHQALDQGINFFDTAPIYGKGTSEVRLGKALKQHDRSQLVVNTKFGRTVEGEENFSADHIRPSVEGSLRRLQFDYLDSVIIHNPPLDYLDGRTNPHYEILERLREEGKIRAYGASLDTYEEMKLLMETTESKVIEAFFNILHQDAARAFEMAQQKGVGIIVKIPLDSGWLTGKYDADSTFEGVRNRWSREDIRTRAALVDRVGTILGPEHNMAQAAIAFCLAYDAVSTVIPGNTTLAQFESNIASTSQRLPTDLVEQLETFYQNEVKALNLPW